MVQNEMSLRDFDVFFLEVPSFSPPALDSQQPVKSDLWLVNVFSEQPSMVQPPRSSSKQGNSGETHHLASKCPAHQDLHLFIYFNFLKTKPIRRFKEDLYLLVI